jgi:putative tryptophan/tyrosine transport system substrate-binding protein
MRRRKFLGVLGGAAAWPLAARAQQPAIPVIGFLRSSSIEVAQHMIAGLRQGLKEAGYIEGENVAIEFRSAEGHNDRLPALAAELIQRRVAVIVCNGVAARAAKAVTASVPIVFVTGADPVWAGLVDTINRPGSNVTGVTFLASTLAAKQIGLLLELVPRAAVIAALIDSSELTGRGVLKDVEATVRAVGRKFIVGQPASEPEIDAALAMFVRERADAVYVQGGPFLIGQRERVVALMARHALPAVYSIRQFAEVGGLMSYAPSQEDAYRQAGNYVGRILQGSKPADMPVVLPTRFELVINLKAAKSLGLSLPPALLVLADEVIE